MKIKIFVKSPFLFFYLRGWKNDLRAAIGFFFYKRSNYFMKQKFLIINNGLTLLLFFVSGVTEENVSENSKKGANTF